MDLFSFRVMETPGLHRMSLHTWTKSISHHFEAMVETITFVGIYQGTIIPEFLRRCETDFATIHRMKVSLLGGSLLV